MYYVPVKNEWQIVLRILNGLCLSEGTVVNGLCLSEGTVVNGLCLSEGTVVNN